MNRLRIKKAQTLIKSGKFTLEQIGEMVGYASMKTFRRAFQKETGMSPSEFLETMPRRRPPLRRMDRPLIL